MKDESIIAQDLPNYGFIQSRLDKTLKEALVKECLNRKNKKTMRSGITNPGVAPHFWLNNDKLFVRIQKKINKMLLLFEEKYKGYANNIKILNENRPLVFHKPWINYQKPNEYIPLHGHSGVFSYNIYVKLPEKSIFTFHYTSSVGTNLHFRINLIKKHEGVIILFPSLLQHVVYPYSGKDKLRISVAGNLFLKT